MQQRYVRFTSVTKYYSWQLINKTFHIHREYPSAKVSPERVTVSQGQSTEIHCTASGFPFPTVKWTKLGGELSSNMEQIGSTLYIRNAQIEDRGVYVCISTNIHGLGQASAMVEVTRE